MRYTTLLLCFCSILLLGSCKSQPSAQNGQPLEVFLGHLIQNKFIRPKVRIYQTNNPVSYTHLTLPTNSRV